MNEAEAAPPTGAASLPCGGGFRAQRKPRMRAVAHCPGRWRGDLTEWALCGGHNSRDGAPYRKNFCRRLPFLCDVEMT